MAKVILLLSFDVLRAECVAPQEVIYDPDVFCLPRDSCCSYNTQCASGCCLETTHLCNATRLDPLPCKNTFRDALDYNAQMILECAAESLNRNSGEQTKTEQKNSTLVSKKSFFEDYSWQVPFYFCLASFCLCSWVVGCCGIAAVKENRRAQDLEITEHILRLEHKLASKGESDEDE